MKPLICLSFTLLVGLTNIVAAEDYGGGNGDANDPYLISTPNDMNAIGANPSHWGKHFLLTEDIDLSAYTGASFSIIGNSTTKFTGVFDGNNHTISNFTYDSPSDSYIGLFGRVDDPGVIKNLRLAEPYVFALGIVGALVGELTLGTISDCGVTGGGISGTVNTGGLVGTNNSGIVSDCYTTINVSGGSGGLAGGIVGYNYNYGTIEKCYASGSVSGMQYVGGLAGLNFNGLIVQSYATGDVLGEERIGGLMGWNATIVSDCYATGDVSGLAYVGGLVGEHNSETIENCYASGGVSGFYSTGGLVGEQNATVTACFWDTETSGQWTGVGSGSSSGVTGKTTTEMKQITTFADWDFVETWGIEDNQTYPFLKLSYPIGDLNYNKMVDFFDFATFGAHWLEGVGP